MLRDQIRLKKKFGQNFLHQQIFADHAVDAVTITPTTSVFEIGCGDGFLTRTLLATKATRVWAFEIDHEWAARVRSQIKDPRLTVVEQDFLTVGRELFEPHKPWILVANLPYHITFPILHFLQQNRDLLSEGVIMIQEEVAQKLTKTSGRGYGYISLFFQHYFSWRVLDKVPPSAFVPAPKVYSRLLYFKPLYPQPIEDEQGFWRFVQVCFKQPRRTLRNNLAQSHYDLSQLTPEILALRAQQLSKDQLRELYRKVVEKLRTD